MSFREIFSFELFAILVIDMVLLLPEKEVSLIFYLFIYLFSNFFICTNNTYLKEDISVVIFIYIFYLPISFTYTVYKCVYFYTFIFISELAEQ